ncbi:hypothetical protein E2C01_041002 [Portunus trituberculatus]|uniref:Uncharacterized protein n=1 Tax=Portunus trituberculatus TaxID=210409 RepID=A0A5B7FIV7_PORTR|nr:hypothetical protein [Portunus trituberculatus]
MVYDSICLRGRPRQSNSRNSEVYVRFPYYIRARTVPPYRGLRRTLVLAFGNRYPEWMPFLTSDRGQDSNPCA